MRSMLFRVGTCSLLVPLLLLGVGPDVAAQEGEPAEEASPVDVGIEEIIVTGRKREEALQDTPASIRAFSSMELEARTMTRVDEIGRSTVNMLFDATDGSNQSSRIYIRGIGQDSSGRLVDPGVGTYLDGVYLPRSSGGLLSLIDLERIEVLRGPQGTLYGKNTVGGVVNLISIPPGAEFGGYGRIRWGNYSTLETRAAMDIPINFGPFEDRLYTRLSVVTATDDGWQKNIVPGMTRISGDNKLLGGRFSFRALPTEDIMVDFHYDRTREHERQRVRHCVPGDAVNLARFLGDNLFNLGEACARSMPLPKHDGFAFPAAKIKPDVEGTNLTLTWDISEDLEFKSISSWRESKTRTSPSETSGADPQVTPSSTLDVDDVFSLTHAVTIPNGGSKARHDTWTEELQLVGSLMDGRLRYVGGLFWFKEKGHTRNIAALPRFYTPGSPTDLAPPGCCAFAVPGQPNDDFVNVALDMQRMTATVLFGQFIPVIEGLTFTAFTDFENTSYAGYANLEYDLTDKLWLEAGVRRTQERRESSASEINFFTGAEDFGVGQNSRFDNWAPMAKLTYRFNDDVLAYLGWARGWKSGGFNSTRAILDDVTVSAQQTISEAKLSEFDPETSDTWEIGMKSSWFDNRLVLNISGFYNTYKDIQLTITQGDARGLATTRIRNAAKARIFGAELEATMVPMDGLTLTFGFGHTNAEYDDFSVLVADPFETDCDNLLNAGLWGQRRAGFDPIPITEDNTNLNRTGDPRVVQFGERLPGQCPFGDIFSILLEDRTFSPAKWDDKHFKFTPAYTLNASVTYRFELFDLGTLSLRGDWFSRSKTYFDTANSPGHDTGTYGLLDGRMTLDLADGQTSLSLWIKNWLDRTYIDGTTNLADSAGFDQFWWGWPRRYGIEVTRRF